VHYEKPVREGVGRPCNQAIELSADVLGNVKFVKEKKLIGKYFDEISQDSGKYVFGVRETLTCLEMGAVETLIVWENLEVGPRTSYPDPDCLLTVYPYTPAASSSLA